MIVGRGLIAGMVACIVYDGARLFAVHVLGLMGDFIPVMGSFVTGEPDTAGSAAVGYIWRYIGDAADLVSRSSSSRSRSASTGGRTSRRCWPPSPSPSSPRGPG